jgi:hypothetical protein
MSAEVIRFEGPRELATVALRSPALFLAEPKASERFWEFFKSWTAWELSLRFKCNRHRPSPLLAPVMIAAWPYSTPLAEPF